MASRAISTITIVDSHGVSWKGKLPHAHRLLYAIPESSRLPDLRAVVANHGTASRSADTVDFARWSNVLRVEPLKLDIQVIRVNSLLGRQLQPIGERIIPILHQLVEFLSDSKRPALLRPPISQKGGKPVFKMVADAAQYIFIGGRLEPPNTRVFAMVLHQPEAQSSRQWIEQEDSNVDPLIADQVRCIP